MKKMLAMMLVAAMGIGLVGTAQPAQADHRHGKPWLALLVALLAPRPTVVYEQPAYCPPPVVYPPPPVVYTLPVVCPPPVVYRPVYVAPPVIHRPPIFHIQPVPYAHPGFRPDYREHGGWGSHRR